MFIPILVLLLFLGVSCIGADTTRVDDFALYDQEGNFHELYDNRDQKAIAIISYRIGCPVAARNLSALEKIDKEFRSRGVKFLLMDPVDNRNDLQKEVKDFGLSIPVLEDPQGIISSSLQFTRAAEVIVIDPVSWQVIYRDTLNASFGEVLSSLLSGNLVTHHPSITPGCLLYSSLTEKQTYTKDIAPILSRKCINCHTPDGVAPWSMDHYEKVKTWGPMIREVLRKQSMPPWHADPHYGRFRDDISLSAKDRKKIIDWIEDGMPRGEGKDILASLKPRNTKEWAFGKPDVILTLQEKQNIPPIATDGQDFFVNLSADQRMPFDGWITAYEIKPSNPRVVHHCNIVVEKQNGDTALSAMPDEKQTEWTKDSGLNIEQGQIIAGYSPGMGVVKFPKDTGIFVPKGSQLTFRMHYVPTGKPEEDLTRVGLYLKKTKPRKVLSVAVIHNREIKIPAGSKDYSLKATYTFQENVTLTMLQPHMHYRGKSMRFLSLYPDGSSEILLSVPNYKFTWQRQYVFETPKKIPAGTQIILSGSYDNSLSNPFNRKPLAEVIYGPGSDQEMFTGIMFYLKE